MENKNINNENNKCKDCGCGCKMEEIPSVIDILLSGMLADVAIRGFVEAMTDDMPEAAPLDLLSKSDYKRMDRYLEKNYGPLRQLIDENYVALLMCLQQYEKVDFDARIKAHIVHNITSAK